MAKYKITTLVTSTKKYYLTYEIEANSEEEAKSKIDGTIPTDEEFFDESNKEEVTDIDEI